MKKTQFNIFVDEDTKKAFRKLAIDLDISPSKLIEQLMKEHIAYINGLDKQNSNK